MFSIQEDLNNIVKGKKIEIIPTIAMRYPLKYTSVLYGNLIYSSNEQKRVKKGMNLQNKFEDLKKFYSLRHNYIVQEAKNRTNDR